MATFNQYASRTLALEKVFIPKLITITKAFRADFIHDLKTHGQSTATSNLQMRMAPDSLTKTVHAVYKRAGLFGVQFEMAGHKKYIAEARRQEQKGFGRNEQWISDVLAYLAEHLLGFVQDITETMRADILRILQKTIDEGRSINDAVKELQAGGLIQSRARVIARTEINRAANVGHSVAAKSLPYEVDKKWSAAADHRTRHSHRFINNHRVDENDFFNVPIYKGDKNTGMTEQMLYPGDANASAGNTVNCRCRITHIPKRDANGALIMKRPNQATIVPMRQIPRYEPSQIAAILKANTFIGVENKVT